MASRWIPPEGAHSDLASRVSIDLGQGFQEKRVHTFNFVFNITLCLPTATSDSRSFCSSAAASTAQKSADRQNSQPDLPGKASS